MVLQCRHPPSIGLVSTPGLACVDSSLQLAAPSSWHLPSRVKQDVSKAAQTAPACFICRCRSRTEDRSSLLRPKACPIMMSVILSRHSCCAYAMCRGSYVDEMEEAKDVVFLSSWSGSAALQASASDRALTPCVRCSVQCPTRREFRQDFKDFTSSETHTSLEERKDRCPWERAFSRCPACACDLQLRNSHAPSCLACGGLCTLRLYAGPTTLLGLCGHQFY